MTNITTTDSWLPKDLHNTHAINPLAGSAAPILTIAYQLSEQAEPISDIATLIMTLTIELKHFYRKADRLGYDAKQILAARYWLCATLDELIMSLPNPQKIQPQSLLAALDHPTTSHQFFSILEEHRNTAKPSADLLEMAYLCLCLGYKGQYSTAHLNAIDTISQSLFNQTQELRKTPRIYNKQ